MNEKAREAKNRYMRAWRKNNPDKVKKYQETYWTNVAQKQAEKGMDGE